MNSPESLHEYTRELVRRGLPVEYACRSAEELADHHRDLIDELRATGMDEATATTTATERLGETKSLVKKTVRAYQRRHWCGRWPGVVFFIMPVPLLIATWMGTLFTLKLFSQVLEPVGYGMPESSHDLSTFGLMLLYAAVGWLLLVIPAVLALALSRLAFRSGIPRGWLVASAVLLAMSVGSVRAGFVPSPESTEHPFVVSIPFLMPFRSANDVILWYLHTPLQVVQLSVPLLVAGTIIWRDTVRRNQLKLAVKP